MVVDTAPRLAAVAFMAQVILRSLDQQVLASHKIKAERHERSPELREILKRGECP